jgi:Transposase DDE domain
MPNKHNADRRHHFGKMKFKVRNWASYEAGLRRRGSLTLWVTDEAIAKWQAPPRQSPGGQAHYSDMAIETALMLRLTFHFPLRQTEGFMESIFALLGMTVSAPDHSTLSRRATTLPSVSLGRISARRKAASARCGAAGSRRGGVSGAVSELIGMPQWHHG